MEKEEILKALFNVIEQSCGGYGDDLLIDNMCISAYEDACRILFEEGYLEKINDRIYKIKEEY